MAPTCFYRSARGYSTKSGRIPFDAGIRASGRKHQSWSRKLPDPPESNALVVVSELEKNLKLCITEKAAKIAPYRAEYLEWWVVLVDSMMAGHQKPVRVFHPFGKLIVIHPSNYSHAYEIQTLV